MARYIHIDGTIETPDSITVHEFMDLFLEWIEYKQGSYFTGSYCQEDEEGNMFYDLTDSIGGRIKLLLEEKRLTQRELAELAGTTEVSISRYIRGQRIPKYTIVSKIANVLNTSNDYLIRGYEKKGE